MNRDDPPPLPASARGTQIALIFALVAERLTAYYEHGQWLSEAQGASLAADWLARRRGELSLKVRRHLSGLSDQMARQIESGLSREAGLYTAHEMMESLDPNYHPGSQVAQALMRECEHVFAASDVELTD